MTGSPTNLFTAKVAERVGLDPVTIAAMIQLLAQMMLLCDDDSDLDPVERIRVAMKKRPRLTRRRLARAWTDAGGDAIYSPNIAKAFIEVANRTDDAMLKAIYNAKMDEMPTGEFEAIK